VTTPKKPKRSAKEIADAVVLLMEQTGRRLVLAANEENDVYVLPSIMPGQRRVEYQVSNGLDGNRSQSLDFYSFAKAMECFEKIKVGGWHNYWRNEVKVG
jgi:hypothetical protein